MTEREKTRAEAPIGAVDVSVHRVPTDGPESDGTLEWDSTTVLLVRAEAGGVRGLGYSYTDEAAGMLVRDALAAVVRGRDAMAVPGSWETMWHAVRNLGRSGVVSSAIAAVDVALWDLKARLLDLPLVALLGEVRDAVDAYGSGGFTSYTIPKLQAQLGGWVEAGIPRVKMKIGRDPDADAARVAAAREAIGPAADLYVDANGAYRRKQALALAQTFRHESAVSWFEEPVPADDLEGLRLLRDRAPAGMAIAVGEYGYRLDDFRAYLAGGAADVLQADATRCGGITGFLRVGGLCDAFHVPLSAHTAPSLHAHPCCALPAALNVEYFYDHARIEHLFFDGALTPVDGKLRPDRSRPGLGLELREEEAARYAI
ncbi:MAG TPA: enolase C-terminal domain-like protein [Longimicrobiaceae bacterium]|nr:enolase C-terminal domain-like protein [Longimicrobiaceae bacterium]